ncbi:MAG: glycosyltransferase, partial [Jannaschia sp.]
MSEGVLIVIPTLNEAAHIGGVLDGLRPFLDRAAGSGRAVRVVVADGGSSDATRRIVAEHPLTGRGSVVLMDNPDRLQSAAVNRAVAEHGAGAEWLIRIDAHARYPE